MKGYGVCFIPRSWACGPFRWVVYYNITGEYRK